MHSKALEWGIERGRRRVIINRKKLIISGYSTVFGRKRAGKPGWVLEEKEVWVIF
ncbi:MAG: hypothetical protein IJC85_03520 [Oscillospiraceae bacterium]|nr:hypothetical protein [Oscillospiraceae bacterium]